MIKRYLFLSLTNAYIDINLILHTMKGTYIMAVIVLSLDLQLPMQSVPIRCTINYVIKFVSDFRQVSGFLLVLRFFPPIKLTATRGGSRISS